MPSRELAVRQITPDVWQTILAIAPTMHASRLFAVTSPEAAAAIMLKGYELGLGLAASFEFIDIIQGKPTLKPHGALALIQASGELEDMKITDYDGGCTVSMKRRNGPEYSVTWTIADAARAGLLKKDSAWEKFPGNMCRKTAIGFVADVLFRDITGGIRRPADEAGDVEDSDLTTTVDDSVAPPAAESFQPAPAAGAKGWGVLTSSWGQHTVQPEISAVVPSLDRLIELYGAEALIVAGEGKIPETDAELIEAEKRLSADNTPW